MYGKKRRNVWKYDDTFVLAGFCFNEELARYRLHCICIKAELLPSVSRADHPPPVLVATVYVVTAFFTPLDWFHFCSSELLAIPKLCFFEKYQ